MISVGCSTTLVLDHAALPIPSAASRTFRSLLLVLLPIPIQVPTLILSLPLLLHPSHLHQHHLRQHLQLLRHQLHQLLSTILSTCMVISACLLWIALFAVRTATTVINHIPSKTPNNGTLLMQPAGAFPTSVLLKATRTLRFSIPIIKMVSAMAVVTAA